jgi:hypothetical protein
MHVILTSGSTRPNVSNFKTSILRAVPAKGNTARFRHVFLPQMEETILANNYVLKVVSTSQVETIHLYQRAS